MTDIQLYNEINSLDHQSKKELKKFLEVLKSQKKSDVKKTMITERKFGCADGLLKMRKDFDEPLNDFKDYMC